MSYAIVRNEKLTRAEVNGKGTHNDRKAKNHTNKDIDPTKTHLNYYIKKNELTYTKEFDKYLKENKELIEKLKSLGVNMKYLGKNMGVNDFISGKKFVITGTIDGYGRKEIKEIIERSYSQQKSPSRNRSYYQWQGYDYTE